MSEEFDQARTEFAKEIAPNAPVRPRDTSGRFAAVAERPEQMFVERRLEGDPETGDTSDGGDDPRLAQREREIADGWIDERAERQVAENTKNLRRAPARREHEPAESEPDESWPDRTDDDTDLEGTDETDEEGSAEAGGSKGDVSPRFEIIVEGETRQVSLNEALRGYVRQATYTKYVNQLQQVKNEIEASNVNLQKNWQLWDKARRDFEEDVANMLPREPADWDAEFLRDANGAHLLQKTFQMIYNKLAQSRSARAEREALQVAERDRQVEKYAIDEFSKFVMEEKIRDETALKKEIQSMRRTAADAGFSEYETATTYDRRMLRVLRWASIYRRWSAARPRAVVPGKGRTLTPGAATPLGNRRGGLDEAQRRLASSGSLDDAAEVFRRML